jgi:hypothetical protein
MRTVISCEKCSEWTPETVFAGYSVYKLSENDGKCKITGKYECSCIGHYCDHFKNKN